ncbi:MAG: sulfite exporter TauE/SafE family protein [Bacteroidia bacterium]
MPLEIFGYIAAVIMGITLGLVGAGGSILTVPVLVYLFSIDAVLATTYALFIVGITGFTGSLRHINTGNINLKTALLFGTPSIASVLITRAFVLPAIPAVLFTAGNLQVTKSIGILLFFAVIMLMASFSMIARPIAVKPDDHPQRDSYFLSVIGLGVGFITGLVGAGGGFLIIPALIFFAGLPMKKAVGTSLIIIAANSFIGFVSSLKHDAVIDWKFLILFSAMAIIGIITGSALAKKIPGEKLKSAFGWFVLAMGVYIIIKETVGR